MDGGPVSEIFSAPSMEQLLGDTRAALERMTRSSTSGTAATDTVSSEPFRAQASDRSDRVTAVVVAPGRIDSLRIEPRLLRDGSDAVGDAIAEAVNAALADLVGQALRGAESIETTSLAVDLERLQADSLASATTMMASLQDAMTRIATPVQR